jgi:hypothetical protein
VVRTLPVGDDLGASTRPDLEDAKRLGQAHRLCRTGRGNTAVPALLSKNREHEQPAARPLRARNVGRGDAKTEDMTTIWEICLGDEPIQA